MADLQKLVEELSSLTVVEAANLSKQLEEKWGVSAAAPVAVTAAGPVAAAVEVQDAFDVVLVDAGASKIGVIKEIRTINPALGLIQAKEFVEKLPNKVKEGVKKEEAEKIKALLEAAGAKVEIK